MKICIFGASSDKLCDGYRAAAARVGELIAAHGHSMVYGGGSTGLMRDCAETLLAGGGSLTGIAPRYFDEPGILRKDKGDFIFTDTMAQRKTLMIDTADAFIALPGGVGTYEELFETLSLKLLGRHSKPIALLNTLGCYNALWSMLSASVRDGFTAPSCLDMICLCSDPEQALAAVENAPKEHHGRSISEYGK